MSDKTMAYAARFPGRPGFGAVCVDKPEYVKVTAKEVAAWIRRGANVERVSIEAARAGMGEYLAAGRVADAAPSGADDPLTA